MESAKKSERSRLNLFYILQVLSRHTDEGHPLSANEIAEKINQEFAHLTTAETLISMDTVKRTLDDLTLTIFPEGMEEEKLTHRYGYFIYTVMKTDSGFAAYRETEGKQPPKKYYYMETDLKEAELLTLKDAVETYSYFSEEDITDIVRKLVRLRPHSFPYSRYYDVARGDRDENSLLLMNIDDLNDIIQHKNCAEITYCAYNSEKKLVVRPGYPKVLEPLHLMWSNGYYYLLAYNEKYESVVCLRMDRITDIREVETKSARHIEQFNPVQYRHEHPVMYSGEKTRIELLCRDTGKNYIMNTIMDVFGKNALVRKADDGLLQSCLHHDAAYFAEQGITWLKVVIESAPGGVELWATQYCTDCIVLAPQELALRVKERLRQGIAYYGTDIDF